jgi:hypothetical protein
VGAKLEALTGVWSGAGLVPSYRWERCRTSCSTIRSATGPRFTPTAAESGARLRVEISARGIEAVRSPSTGAVQMRPRSLSRPSIRGQPRIGSMLVARTGSWAGTRLRLETRWLRCRGACVAAGSRPTYRVRARDRGHRLVLEVVASNELGLATARSRATGVVR